MIAFDFGDGVSPTGFRAVVSMRPLSLRNDERILEDRRDGSSSPLHFESEGRRFASFQAHQLQELLRYPHQFEAVALVLALKRRRERVQPRAHELFGPYPHGFGGMSTLIMGSRLAENGA